MEAAAWAEREFGQAERSSTSLPEKCSDWAGQKAGYRFFSNEGIRPASILGSHVEATVERMAAESVVLAVQDTTTLNYSHHPGTIGLGALNTAQQRGLLMHTTLALTPERVPLGLVEQEVWARDPAVVGNGPRASSVRSPRRRARSD